MHSSARQTLSASAALISSHVASLFSNAAVMSASGFSLAAHTTKQGDTSTMERRYPNASSGKTMSVKPGNQLGVRGLGIGVLHVCTLDVRGRAFELDQGVVGTEASHAER